MEADWKQWKKAKEKANKEKDPEKAAEIMDDWLKNGPALTLGTGNKCTELMDYACYVSPGENQEIFILEAVYIVLS